jgi:serine/threonine protein kinase
MDENYEVCFIDFSSSMFTEELTGSESPAGTFPFTAPEAFKGILKNVSNYRVMDNHSVGYDLLDMLTSENFRRKVNELPIERELPYLVTKELFNLTPDLFLERVQEFEDRLDQLIEEDSSPELEQISTDRKLQDMIFKSYGRSKSIKIILALTKINPDERMSLPEAESEWGKMETELQETYQAFKDILKAKALLSKKIPQDLINKSTDKMVEMERREKARTGRRSSQTTKIATSSSSDSEKKSSDGSSSPGSSSSSSSPTIGTRF